MRELDNFLNRVSPRAGRYCVWVEERAGGRSRLAQMWIDPSMELFEQSKESQELVSAGQDEEPHPVLMGGRGYTHGRRANESLYF